ncbi:transferase family-domain-containing protein [Naematelia encephala]|uniref:Transferase family-domain-containing protein n=1 Tax=Naematelia encephala TaxID=71784 RepID=A0A1Y2BF46_9TREE|nr:transferase family-domain-containing protein [Naematelia encephala]
MPTASTGTDQVSILYEQLVHCSDALSIASLPTPFRLGPLDQLVGPHIPVAVVFVYESPNPTSSGRSSPDIIPIDTLRPALSRLFDYYPHLTGRLRLDASDGVPYLDSFNMGAGLVTATCPLRLDTLHPSDRRLIMSDLPLGGNALLPPYNPENVCEEPILAIQHTQFACGAVALGVRCLHKVCDAEGFFQIVRDLAEVYRSLGDGSGGRLSRLPEIRPYLADWNVEDLSEGELQKVLDYRPELFFVDSPSKDLDAEIDVKPMTPLPPVTGRFMRFSGGELAALKAHATEPGTWISTFDALTAHLHQRIHLARLELRRLDNSQPELSPPNFLTPVNIRTRLRLNPQYQPNALICTYTSISPSTLQHGPLSAIAKAIHETPRTEGTTSRSEMEQTLKWMAAQSEKSRIRQGFQYGNGSFMASQWNKMDIYVGTAFEQRPILVAPPFTSISLVDGLGYYLPTEMQGDEADKGDIEVDLALCEPLWKILDRDLEFRRFRI